MGKLVEELDKNELYKELTPEQRLTDYVRFILRYIREAYHPHVIVTSRGMIN